MTDFLVGAAVFAIGATFGVIIAIAMIGYSIDRSVSEPDLDDPFDPYNLN